MKLLIVEDEKDMNELLAEKLRRENYVVDTCFDGMTALDYASVGDYDGIILDIMLPKMDGIAVLRTLRRQRIYTPVLLLSARSEEYDIVNGLDRGADDYLVKPFSFDVLLARLRVMLRKNVGVHDSVYRCGDLEIRENTREVFRCGDQIDLTAKEYSILMYLVRNQNTVLSREQILSGVWNDDGELSSNVVDVYIRYLRQKLDNPYEFKMIRTVRGVGYCLKGNDSE